MNIIEIEQALEQIEQWEAENAHHNPTTGSEDEINLAGCFTRVGGYVVYCYLTQGQILSEVWEATDVMETVKAVNRNALESPRAPFELWKEYKPNGVVPR